MALTAGIKFSNQLGNLQRCCCSMNPNTFGHQLLIPRQSVLKIPQATRVTVFQLDRKAGYSKPHNVSKMKMAIDGVKELKGETKLFFKEWKTKLENDAVVDREHLDHTYLWRFNSPSDTARWVVTRDADHNEGSSTAAFEINKHGNGLFHGNLSTKVPKDGVVKHSGYVNIRAPRQMRSFKRYIPYDLERYTHFVMKVRGDGRTYMVNIQMDMHYDIHWDDVYNFALYTRGGPYWQVAKIPLSRFYKAFKGRIQDKQEDVALDRIASVGITLGEGNSGPFQLEIDYIGAMYDLNHTENFAWEMYQSEPYILGT